MRSIQAVFFDLDGVLIDSEALWREAIGAAFEAVGILFDEALYDLCAGMDNQGGIRAVLERFPECRADPERLRHEIETRVTQLLVENPYPMPGVSGLLSAIAESGRGMALVSSSPRPLILKVLDGQQWRRYFEVVLSSEEVGPGKPDPAVYREAVRRMGVAASRGLAVEDTLAGALSARGAGLSVLALPSYPSERRELETVACHVVADFGAAAQWLLSRLENDVA